MHWYLVVTFRCYTFALRNCTGLHYHMTEPQVLEMLQTFGRVKSFHLVKSEPESPTSKGFCFLEYEDTNVTKVAVEGLNGMDLGGGKIITARVATQRGAPPPAPTTVPTSVPAPVHTGTAPMIIGGFEIDNLLDAAMGKCPMPTAPTHMDANGLPITRTGTFVALPGAPMSTDNVSVPPPPPPPPAGSGIMAGKSPLDIANAALDAAFGSAPAAGAPAAGTVPPPPPPPPASTGPTRILVLHNMVIDEDLSTDDEYEGLKEEVEGECAKVGKLLGMKIPRVANENVQPSAIKKVFLEYATVQDATTAEKELGGRQFGSNVVKVSRTSIGGSMLLHVREDDVRYHASHDLVFWGLAR